MRPTKVAGPCSKCGGERTPVRSRAGKLGSGYRCRPCWAAYMRGFYKTPERLQKKRAGQARRYRETIPQRKSEHLRINYGIDLAEYQRMSEQQGHVCAICEGPPAKGKSLGVDHCHATGTVRALLCNNCNQGLGHAKDDPERLRAMADYLEQHRLIPVAGAGVLIPAGG